MKTKKIMNCVCKIVIFVFVCALFCVKSDTKASAGEVPDGTYNYLAIGNSITEHPVTDYWWGQWGMAANLPDNDYYHKIVSYLSANAPVSAQALYFKSWETAASGAARSAQLTNLDGYLNGNTDLVTIQLGENISDQTYLTDDYANLVSYIRNKAPNAQIIMIGEFWTDTGKDDAKKTVCMNQGITFVDLTAIQGSGYRIGLGASVYGSDGLWHTVTDAGVAEHPNNAAMQYIADQVMRYMDFTYYAGVNYAPVFDEEYYYNSYEDLRAAFGFARHDLFNHFIANGMKEGRQASAGFNVQTYKNRYADLRSAFGKNLPDYYLHYVCYGRNEGRDATGSAELSGAVTIQNGVDYAAVYDYHYYIEANPDVAAAFPGDDTAVLEHFVNYGMKEGRLAKDTFNVHSYRAAYGDLRAAFGGDLTQYYLHYIRNGCAESRSATGSTAITNGVTVCDGIDYAAVYDYHYYIEANPDVAAAFPGDDVAVLLHFINCGMNEGRMAKADFNVRIYQNNYADLQAAYGSDLRSYYLHYMNWGKNEGRSGY